YLRCPRRPLLPRPLNLIPRRFLPSPPPRNSSCKPHASKRNSALCFSRKRLPPRRLLPPRNPLRSQRLQLRKLPKKFSISLRKLPNPLFIASPNPFCPPANQRPQLSASMKKSKFLPGSLRSPKTRNRPWSIPLSQRKPRPITLSRWTPKSLMTLWLPTPLAVRKRQSSADNCWANLPLPLWKVLPPARKKGCTSALLPQRFSLPAGLGTTTRLFPVPRQSPPRIPPVFPRSPNRFRPLSPILLRHQRSRVLLPTT